MDESITYRFWKFVYKTHNCWFWLGSVGPAGHGVFSIRAYPVAAHRTSWEIHFGEIPQGMWVLHKCDTPPCIRPDHLYLGTATDNAKDTAKAGHHGYRAFNTHCKNGHEFTPENTRIWHNGRQCITCMGINNARHYAKLKHFGSGSASD